jgi:hypothetical protein
MAIKSGYLSLHNGGTGAGFEITTGTGSAARQFAVFDTAFDFGTSAVMVSNHAISFASPAFSKPSGTVAISASVYTYVVPTLTVSGALYAPLLPTAINADGTPLNPVPVAGYAVRVGMWDALTGGTFRENVQFTNLVTPFTASVPSGNIDFPIGALAVTPQ